MKHVKNFNYFFIFISSSQVTFRNELTTRSKRLNIIFFSIRLYGHENLNLISINRLYARWQITPYPQQRHVWCLFEQRTNLVQHSFSEKKYVYYTFFLGKLNFSRYVVFCSKSIKIPCHAISIYHLYYIC